MRVMRDAVLATCMIAQPLAWLQLTHVVAPSLVVRHTTPQGSDDAHPTNPHDHLKTTGKLEIL
jgi:hypothetical protein